MIDEIVGQRGTVHADQYRQKILPLRNRVEVENWWLRERLETILPEIMKREGFDMWILVGRQYTEDPVLLTLLPEPLLYAHATIVFYLPPDGELERLTLSRRPLGDFYRSIWYDDQEEQYDCLARLIKERDPKIIGLNISKEFGHSSALPYSEYVKISEALGEEYLGRVKSAERLSIGWLERRSPSELNVYPGIVEIGHAIIAEAFSSRVIQPGITTTDDVVWWMRDKMQALGLECWFQPTVDIQSAEMPFEDWNQLFFHHGEREEKRTTILPGDLLHCDMGFTYLRLSTDQQQNAYVLKSRETDVPEGLKAALAEANRLQDIHADAMVAGRTGNEMLKVAMDRAKEEGINARIYTHPIGYHGHGAGPPIGSWTKPEGVPIRGDYELFDDTCYSIEFMVTKPVPEWNDQEVRIALEEDAAFTGGKLQWLEGRQTNFHIIG